MQQKEQQEKTYQIGNYIVTESQLKLIQLRGASLPYPIIPLN